jgi:hypothetical protein
MMCLPEETPAPQLEKVSQNTTAEAQSTQRKFYFLF